MVLRAAAYYSPFFGWQTLPLVRLVVFAAAGDLLQPFTVSLGRQLRTQRSKLDPRARVARELSRRTHKRGRGAPRDYPWRFRRAGRQRKGPRRVAAAEKERHRHNN